MGESLTSKKKIFNFNILSIVSSPIQEPFGCCKKRCCKNDDCDDSDGDCCCRGKNSSN